MGPSVDHPHPNQAHINTLTNRPPQASRGAATQKHLSLSLSLSFFSSVKMFLVLTDLENLDNLVCVQGWGDIGARDSGLTLNILFLCFPHLPSFFINRICYHEHLHKEGPLNCISIAVLTKWRQSLFSLVGLLCARYCSRCLGENSIQNGQKSLSSKV